MFMFISFASFAQESNDGPPCIHEEHSNLSFLIGEWKVTSRKLASYEGEKWEESKGQSTWELELDGCLHIENWKGIIDNKPLRWTQWLVYDHRNKRWQQSMVDTSHGNLITSEGYFSEDKLILTVPTMRNGKLLIDKTTFSKLNDGSFEVVIQSSFDGGSTWKVFWKMYYQKK